MEVGQGIDGPSCVNGAQAASQKTPAAITCLACFFFYQRRAYQQGEKNTAICEPYIVSQAVF